MENYSIKIYKIHIKSYFIWNIYLNKNISKISMKRKKINQEFKDYLEEQLDADSMDSSDEGFMLGYYDDDDFE